MIRTIISMLSALAIQPTLEAQPVIDNCQIDLEIDFSKEVNVDTTISDDGRLVVNAKERSSAGTSAIFSLRRVGGSIKRHGSFTLNGPNGIATLKADYVDGKLKSMTFYDIFFSETYTIEASRFDGVYYSYFSEGKRGVRSAGLYKKNGRYGHWREHYPNGNLKDSGRYSGFFLRVYYDYKNNTGYFYDSDCRIVMKEHSFHRFRKTLSNSYGVELGEISFPFVLFRKEGNWRSYSEKGELLSSVEYADNDICAFEAVPCTN